MAIVTATAIATEVGENLTVTYQYRVLTTKKLAWLALTLGSLAGCSPPCAGWKSDHSTGCPKLANSMRLYLPPSTGCNGLEIEFVRTGEGVRLYLNAFGLEIPATAGDDALSEVFVSFGEHSYCFVADRFLGGQRLLIPRNVQDEIVETLQDGLRVFIRVGRYQADIYPQQFMRLFKQMIGQK